MTAGPTAVRSARTTYRPGSPARWPPPARPVPRRRSRCSFSVPPVLGHFRYGRSSTRVEVPVQVAYVTDIRDAVSIGEAARRTGVPVRTIRFYCDEGLLVTGRTTGGH
ncbi:MAG: MerR family transcriptional regulator, partial [Nocardia sp.]|nr:MerR family transcriptional regulator [Nocardia sp.]